MFLKNLLFNNQPLAALKSKAHFQVQIDNFSMPIATFCASFTNKNSFPFRAGMTLNSGDIHGFKCARVSGGGGGGA